MWEFYKFTKNINVIGKYICYILYIVYYEIYFYYIYFLLNFIVTPECVNNFLFKFLEKIYFINVNLILINKKKTNQIYNPLKDYYDILFIILLNVLHNIFIIYFTIYMTTACTIYIGCPDLQRQYENAI